jgi:hypothetical protein
MDINDKVIKIVSGGYREYTGHSYSFNGGAVALVLDLEKGNKTGTIKHYIEQSSGPTIIHELLNQVRHLLDKYQNKLIRQRLDTGKFIKKIYENKEEKEEGTLLSIEIEFNDILERVKNIFGTNMTVPKVPKINEENSILETARNIAKVEKYLSKIARRLTAIIDYVKELIIINVFMA